MVFRALGRLPQFARVGTSGLIVLRGTRGSLQGGVFRQRFVLRSQAISVTPLPGIQSSSIVRVYDGVGVCRLTRHSSGRLRRRLIPALGFVKYGEQMNPIEVLNMVNTFYDQAFSRLLIITFGIVAFIGVIIPIAVGWLQSRSLRAEKNSLLNELKAEAFVGTERDG